MNADEQKKISATWMVIFLIILLLVACDSKVPAINLSTTIQPASTEPSTLSSVIVYTSTLVSISRSTYTEHTNASTNLESTMIPILSTVPPVATPTQLSPGDWMSLPIIPSVSQTARQIYQHGLELGNNPHAFSKIGDCQSITTYFLAYFDLPGNFDLGPYTSLQETIDWFSGSFIRESLAVKGGFNAAAILSPLRADPKQCRSSENPISCEIRLNHPSIALISLEEWWAGHPENYEKYMRQIIEYTINQGVVPIIATKADNIEGNHLINDTIANLAQEYNIPLWNFWAAVQDLPNHGLAAYDPSGIVDMFHLTHGENYNFSEDSNIERSGWTMRNLTALQALDAVRRGLVEQP